MTRTEIFEGVKTVLQESLGVTPEVITPEASLATDLGADSLDLMDIVVHLNRRFSLKLSAKELARQLHEGHLFAAAASSGGSAGENGAGSTAEAAGPGGDRRKTAELVTVSFLVEAVENYVCAPAQMP
jgi:acyl carrier protein